MALLLLLSVMPIDVSVLVAQALSVRICLNVYLHVVVISRGQTGEMMTRYALLPHVHFSISVYVTSIMDLQIQRVFVHTVLTRSSTINEVAPMQLFAVLMK